MAEYTFCCILRDPLVSRQDNGCIDVIWRTGVDGPTVTLNRPTGLQILVPCYVD